MLTAMTAVDNIVANVRSRANLWALNTESEYHEEKSLQRHSDSRLLPRARWPILHHAAGNFRC